MFSVVAWSLENQELQFEENKQLDTVNSETFTLCSNWKLSVELKIDLWESYGQEANVFGVSIKDTPNGSIGSRIPAVFVSARSQQAGNQNTNHFRLANSASTDGFYRGVDITGTPFTLEMSDSNGKYEVRINDVVVHTIEGAVNPNYPFDNVEAIIGNRWDVDQSSYGGSWLVTPVSGYYKNFKLWTNCEGKNHIESRNCTVMNFRLIVTTYSLTNTAQISIFS